MNSDTRLTGFNVTRNGEWIAGTYMDETVAKDKLAYYRNLYQDDEIFVEPVNVFFPGDHRTAFGYRRLEQDWYLEKYTGMGNVDYFSMPDHEALKFADAVYAELGKLPGDLIKSTLVGQLDSIIGTAERAKKGLE